MAWGISYSEWLGKPQYENGVVTAEVWIYPKGCPQPMSDRAAILAAKAAGEAKVLKADPEFYWDEVSFDEVDGMAVNVTCSFRYDADSVDADSVDDIKDEAENALYEVASDLIPDGYDMDITDILEMDYSTPYEPDPDEYYDKIRGL